MTPTTPSDIDGITPSDIDGITIAVERITAAYTGATPDEPPRTLDHYLLRITGPGTTAFEAEYADLAQVESLARRIITTARAARPTFEPMRQALIPAGWLVNQSVSDVDRFDPAEGWQTVYRAHLEDGRVRGLAFADGVSPDTPVWIRARTDHPLWPTLDDKAAPLGEDVATDDGEADGRRLGIGHVLGEGHDAASCAECQRRTQPRRTEAQA